VTNLNTVDVIDIIGLMRFRDGVPADFTQDAKAANPLGPGDIIVIREEVMLDVCLDAAIETVAVVAAEVPGGIPCMDEAINRFFTGNLAGAITPTVSSAPSVSPAPTVTPSPTITPSPTATPNPASSSTPPFLPSLPPVSLTATPTSAGIDPLPTSGTETDAPLAAPTDPPTETPTKSPTNEPTGTPTTTPTPAPTKAPSIAPVVMSETPSISGVGEFPSSSETEAPTISGVDPLPTFPTPGMPSDSSGSGAPTIEDGGQLPNPPSAGVPTISPVPTVSPAPTITSMPTETFSPTIDGIDPLPTPSSQGSPTVSSTPTTSPEPTITSMPTESSSPTFIGIDPLPTPPSQGSPTVSSTPTASPEPTITPMPTGSALPTFIGIDTFPSVSSSPTTSPKPTVSLFPTVTPSPSAVEVIPSDAPTAAFCNVTAVVSCEDEDGEPCDFVDPVGQQCLGEKASELRFIYQADSFCQGNNTQNNFACLDENPDLPRPATVYIRFYFGDDTFYEGIVSSGNIISVPLSESSNAVVVEISNLNDDNTPNLLLQSMLLSAQCREEDALVLYDTFGSLQLTGYRNEDQGLNSIFTTVTIRNTATNIGTKGAFLSGAFKTNPITGMVPLLPEGATLPLDPGQSQSFSDVFTLNLGTLVGMPIEFSFLTSGTDVDTGAECGNSDTYTLLVSP
jgi:hypothetical protein